MNDTRYEQTELELAPLGETKHEAFVRLINKRLPNSVKRLRLVGNLASVNYEYTDEQAEQVIEVLESELEKVKKQFRGEIAGDDIPTIL